MSPDDIALSISGLARATLCPPSLVLPHVRWTSSYAEMGSVIHRFLQRVPVVGAAAALEEVVDPKHRAACEAINLERLPTLDPEKYVHEVAIAYDPVTDTARELGRGIERSEVARLARPGEVTGILDVLGMGDDFAIVADYKTGRRDRGPLRQHWQLLGYAVLGSRLLGVERVLVARIRLLESGEPWFDDLLLGALDLDSTSVSIQRALAEAHLARERIAAGGRAALNRGEHCEYCPAMPRCPAFVELATAASLAVQEHSPKLIAPALDIGELSAETAPRHLALAAQLEYAAAWVRRSVDTFARGTPFQLPNGNLYGPHPVTRERIDAAKAVDGTRELLPPEDVALLEAATERKMSKEGIKRAIRAAKVKDPTLRIVADQRRLLVALRAVGALSETTTNPVGEYKPETKRLSDGETEEECEG